MDTINIGTYIIINPKEIGKNLDALIKKKLYSLYVNKCIKKYGYIFEILHYSYDKNIITSRVNEFMYVKCNVKILTITPKVGEIYYGIVRIVYQQGIFISLVNTFDTLIPFESLKRAGYTFINGSFIKGIHIITKNSILNVKVTAINYDKNNFNCIANIIDNKDIWTINVITKDDEISDEISDEETN